MKNTHATDPNPHIEALLTWVNYMISPNNAPQDYIALAQLEEALENVQQRLKS